VDRNCYIAFIISFLAGFLLVGFLQVGFFTGRFFARVYGQWLGLWSMVGFLHVGRQYFVRKIDPSGFDCQVLYLLGIIVWLGFSLVPQNLGKNLSTNSKN
jgi:hypothetical protein